MQSGIYEQLISKLISAKLNRLDIKQYYIQQVPIDKVEASLVLSRYIAKIIQTALNLMPQENSVLIIEGVRQNWVPKPIEVVAHHFNFLENFVAEEIGRCIITRHMVDEMCEILEN